MTDQQARFHSLRRRFTLWKSSRPVMVRTKPASVYHPRVPVEQRMERIRALAMAGATRRTLNKSHGYPLTLIARAERELGFAVPTARMGRPRQHFIETIRAAYATCFNCAIVARELGLSRSTVYRIAVQEVKP